MTSIYKDLEDDQNEVRKIVAVSGQCDNVFHRLTPSDLSGCVARAVQLDSPLTFFHYAGKEYQTEVALLSRKVLMDGGGEYNNGFGGHIMIMYDLHGVFSILRL